MRQPVSPTHHLVASAEAGPQGDRDDHWPWITAFAAMTSRL